MRLYLDENDPAGRGYPGMWDGEGVGRLGHVLKGRRWDLVPQARLGISEAGAGRRSGPGAERQSLESLRTVPVPLK